MIFSSFAIVVLSGAIVVTLAHSTFRLRRITMDERRAVDRTETPMISATPFQQPEVPQSDAIDPVPAPAPRAPVSTDARSGAKTATVLDKTGSVPSAQAGGRVTDAEVLVPDAEQRRTALTAAEKAAVVRGLKELEIAAVATSELDPKYLTNSVDEEARAKH